MTLEEILQIDGIIIRKIPAVTITRWSYYPQTQRIEDNEKLIWVTCKPSKGFPDGKRQLIEKTQQNALAGYVVDFQLDQYSTVKFSNMSGYGKTIEEAYADYFSKRNQPS